MGGMTTYQTTPDVMAPTVAGERAFVAIHGVLDMMCRWLLPEITDDDLERIEYMRSMSKQ